MSLDMTESIAPKSDQLNADDLMAGPVTVTISEVSKGTPEQPVDVHLVEFPGRAYRPSKSMRRIMVAAWGKDASAYAGHRLTLYRNPEITFGRDKVGGIEIGAMSHLEKPLTVALTATRGKRKQFKVEQLQEAAPSAPSTEIPQQVRDTVAGIPTREETLSYHDYLKAEGAPIFVLNYVAIQAEQKEPLA